MNIFAIVFGSLLFIGLLCFNVYKLIKMCRTHVNSNIKQSFKKDLLLLLIVSIGYGIAGMSLILGLGYFKNRSFLPGHLVEIIFGSLLFFPSFFVFLNAFFLKHFKHDYDHKFLRIVRYSLLIAILSSIVFFLLLMDGIAPYLTYPFPNSIIFGGPNGAVDFGYPNAKVSGGFSIAFYAICILSGAVFVYFLCDHRFYKIYGKHGMLESTFLIAFPAGIIGARLWFCYVLEFDKYSKWDGSWGSNVHNNPFQIWDGGLAIMGGALLGIIVGLLWVMFKKKEIRIREGVDIIVPTILIAQAIGRWGNFFNQEVYATAMINFSDAWWIPSFIKYSMISIDSYPLHPILGNEITSFHIPLFYVEFITNLAGYFFIRYLFEEKLLLKGVAITSKTISKKMNKPISQKTYDTIVNAFPIGGCAGLYLVWYGFTRFFLEPLRQSEYEYSQSFYSAIGLIVGGIAVIVILAIYQYLIEPKHPFRIAKQTNTTVNDEITKNIEVKKEETITKKSKKSSINDEL